MTKAEAAQVLRGAFQDEHPGHMTRRLSLAMGEQALRIFDALERASLEVTFGKVADGGAYPWFARCGELACRGESLTDALGQLTTVLELL